METKENVKEKNNVDTGIGKIMKPFVAILILIALCVYFFPYILAVSVVSIFSTSISSKLITLSIYIVLISVVYIIYKYIMLMAKCIKEKKKVPSIIMIVLTLLAIIVSIIIKLQTNMGTIGLIMSSIYFFGIIIIPLIMIGFAILGKSKNKTIQITKIILAIVITIFIYVVNIPILKTFAQNISGRIEILREKAEETGYVSDLESGKINIDYLENYRQKMEKQGYIDKYDVNSIIDIASKRVDDITITYTDENGENYKVTNKDEDGWKENIQDKLKSDYYKFSYTYENNQSNIFIEKYIVNNIIFE